MQNQNKNIHPNLIKAYKQALYEIYLPNSTSTFQVGIEIPNDLLTFMQRGAHTCAVFISPCNPHSEKLSDQDNQIQIELLHNHLKQNNYAFIGASGIDPKKQWPSEPGFLILDINQNDAMKICLRFRQNAYVWLGKNSEKTALEAQLILCN